MLRRVHQLRPVSLVDDFIRTVQLAEGDEVREDARDGLVIASSQWSGDLVRETNGQAISRTLSMSASEILEAFKALDRYCL